MIIHLRILSLIISFNLENGATDLLIILINLFNILIRRDNELLAVNRLLITIYKLTLRLEACSLLMSLVIEETILFPFLHVSQILLTFCIE